MIQKMNSRWIDRLRSGWPAAGRRRNSRRLAWIACERLESRYALSGDFAFAGAFAGAGDDAGKAIATDSVGNVYSTGYFQGTMDFDPGAGTFNLTSAGSYDVFVSKVDIAGNFVWAKSLGGTDVDVANAIALDAFGNVYTTGHFRGTADFDPGAGTLNLTSAGGFDGFVSKLDSAGNFVWAKALGGTSDDSASGIALDAFGNVYTTGNFFGTADFNPGDGTFNLSSAGSRDGFVSRLDNAGNFVWAKALGGTSDDYASAIALDAFGNVYTTGYFIGTADFDPGAGTFNLTSAGARDGFVSRLDSAGNFSWAKALGGTSDDVANAIALDAFGNVYTTGSFSGTANFDPGVGTFNLTSAGSIDVFVSRLDSAGNFSWAKALGGTNDDRAIAIALDAFGNVYTTGYFYGTADFDPGAGRFNLTSSAGSDDVFVSKLDSVGNFVWAKALGGTNSDSANAIALDAFGNVYTTGYFWGTSDFDPGAGTFDLTSAGSGDVFVSKLTQEFLFTTIGIGADQIVLRRNGPNLEIFDVLKNQVVAVRKLSLLLGVQITGTVNETDRLTIDYQFGGSFSLPQGIRFNGGTGGGDFYEFLGTSDAEDLRLLWNSVTSANFIRKPRGLSTVLEQDTITYDASDEVSIKALGGDDSIAVDLAFTFLGIVDGGDGTDTCIAPAAWTKVSC